MFDIGFWELCVIGVVLLLVLGPERMPEVAKQIGYWVGRTRRTVNSLRAEMKRELDALPTHEIAQAAKLAREDLGKIQAEMTDLNKDLQKKVGAVAEEVEEVANTRLDVQAEPADNEREPEVSDGAPEAATEVEIAVDNPGPESEKSS